MTITTTTTPLAAAAAGADPRLLYRFEARLVPTILGIVPEGMRIQSTFDGRVTEGLLADHGFRGARVHGIDHLLLRRDGVGVIDAPKSVSIGDRHVFEHVRGYCLPPAGLELPPLEALLEPGFAWPDLPFPILGATEFRTAVPELTWLNRSLARIEGWADFANERLVIETRIVEATGRVALSRAA